MIFNNNYNNKLITGRVPDLVSAGNKEFLLNVQTTM